jgi:hypothetical protein
MSQALTALGQRLSTNLELTLERATGATSRVVWRKV